MADPAPTDEDRLKAALWHRVGTLVDHACAALGSNATPQFIGALADLVYAQVGIAARDVEAFARHAGRTVVGEEDVLLLARRNAELGGVLRAAGERRRREG